MINSKCNFSVGPLVAGEMSQYFLGAFLIFATEISAFSPTGHQALLVLFSWASPVFSPCFCFAGLTPRSSAGSGQVPGRSLTSGIVVIPLKLCQPSKGCKHQLGEAGEDRQQCWTSQKQIRDELDAAAGSASLCPFSALLTSWFLLGFFGSPGSVSTCSRSMPCKESSTRITSRQPCIIQPR